MITQYTRLVVDSVTGDIVHCTSQVFPFADGWQPVEDDSITKVYYDFEIETDFPDADFGIGVSQEMLRARKIIDNFEIVAEQPQLKTGADSEVASKVLRVSATKSIQETDVKLELADIIRVALDSGGSSEKELLGVMLEKDATTPTKIEDLSMVKIIRLKKAL